MDGVLLIEKPEGPTSHDVVARLRRILGVPRIGHFGTLDPFATGLLVLGVGKATRLSPFLSSGDKTYEGRLQFGIATDTYDRTGRIISSAAPPWPGLDAVAAAMTEFAGELSQMPPPFSAKKIKGRPLYDFARRGQDVERTACRITIRAFDLVAYDPPDLDFRVRCSAGTYVRSLAHDLGRRLGCGAHLSLLVRTVSGSFRREDAVTLDAVRNLAEAGRAAEALQPLETLLPDFPKTVLTAEGIALIARGRSVGPEAVAAPGCEETPARFESGPTPVRLFGPDGRLAALARPNPEGSVLAPFLVLL